MAESAREVLAAVAEEFVEFVVDEGDVGDGPLGWDGYGLARKRAAERTGADESVVVPP